MHYLRFFFFIHLFVLLFFFVFVFVFFFSSRGRHTWSYGVWSSGVCSSDLVFLFCGSMLFSFLCVSFFFSFFFSSGMCVRRSHPPSTTHPLQSLLSCSLFWFLTLFFNLMTIPTGVACSVLFFDEKSAFLGTGR